MLENIQGICFVPTIVDKMCFIDGNKYKVLLKIWGFKHAPTRLINCRLRRLEY